MIGRQTGDNGCRFLAITTAHTGLKLYALVVNTDAVFTTLTATSVTDSTQTINMLTNTSYNFTGATIIAKAYIVAPPDYMITAVTMSSGNAIGYNYQG
jgi:hypothetical protein